MALLDTGYRSLEGEYESLLAPTQSRPKAVLFGDSMSEYVGYNADGTPNTKYGNSIADVIGNNLGISVENLATGGETSNEALAGGSKFGAFAEYIAQNRPEYAIIRYGAADAIKNQDPNVTLQSVQQMVDIARANGVTPIIVGVSELYGAQNSKTGNIAGYIDPGAEQRANAINEGLARIAANNGISFTDVRSAVSAGKGDLLDGVHTNADFGKKMADAISESIVSQGAIEGVNVPTLPPNVDSLSAQEKGRLYNDLISQGYTDAQLRTAARAESDEDWNALKRIAAEVKSTTPAEIERKATLSAAPQAEAPPSGAAEVAAPGGLLGSQSVTDKPLIPADVKSQLDAFGPYDPNSEVWYYGGPQIVSDGKIYRKDPSGYVDITIAGGGPGSLQQVVSPTGELVLSTTDTGETSRFMAFMQTALPAVAGAALLGPAGTGLFSAPTAAAVASGGTTLAKGGSVEDALKAAALAGLTGYGLDYLTASPELLAARELALSGMSEEAIVDTLISRGVSTNVAIEAASNATGLPAAGANRGLEFSSTGAAPDVIVTGGSAVAPGVSAVSPAVAAALPVTSAATPGLLNQQVQVQSQTGGAQQTMPFPVVPGLVSTTPLQSVPVTSQPTTNAQAISPETAGTILSALTGSPVSVGGSQTVQVTGQNQGKTVDPEVASALISSALGQSVVVTGQTIPQVEASQAAPAAAAALIPTTQGVTVTGQTLAPSQTNVAPAAAAGLLAPTQGVTVTGQTLPTQQQNAAASAGLLTSTAPTQRVETTGQRQVTVEDRTIPTLTMAPTIPVKATEAVTVEGKKESVPTATAVIPNTTAGVTAPATTPSITAKDAALAALLLGGAGSLGGGGQVGEPVSGPISGLTPAYPGRGNYQMPGLFQIAPTNVYNPFATVAPFGAGRFGAVNKPITLPYGLLAGPMGLTAGINAPTRGLV